MPIGWAHPEWKTRRTDHVAVSWLFYYFVFLRNSVDAVCGGVDCGQDGLE
jgi:hypothetical protein